MDVAVADPARLGTATLRDGRRLGWAEWGPEGGVPVVLCPGAATSRSLGFGTDVLAERGVRLVSADRPGLGASDPAPGRTLLDWPGDLAELAADRGLGTPLVVGYSQGAPFALACAAAGAARAVAVATLARRIPGARHHVVADGGGGALLWTHAEPILRALLDRAGG